MAKRQAPDTQAQALQHRFVSEVAQGEHGHRQAASTAPTQLTEIPLQKPRAVTAFDRRCVPARAAHLIRITLWQQPWTGTTIDVECTATGHIGPSAQAVSPSTR